MRLTALGLAVLTACAMHRPVAPLAVPTPLAGRVSAVAATRDPVGDVRPVAVAVTNGLDETLRLDARQISAHGPDDVRVAPLPPAEAARRAGGHRPSGAVRQGAVGAATGGLLGAIGGAISGAILGGVDLAAAAGGAVGAFFGAITGLTHGGGEPDIAGFEDRALHDATLARGFSADGLVYCPRGAWRSLEILLVNERGEAEAVQVPIDEPAP